MKKVLIVLGALVGLVVLAGVVVVTVGALQPVDHVASSRATIGAPPQEVWDRVADFSGWPGWSSAFETAEQEPDRDGKPYWLLEGGFGPMPIVIEERTPPEKLVTRIPEDAGLGYHGTWTYALAPAEGGGTRVTVTEAGTVPNPFFRGVTALFLGRHMAMNAFLVDLGESFGEDVEPEELPGG